MESDSIFTEKVKISTDDYYSSCFWRGVARDQHSLFWCWGATQGDSVTRPITQRGSLWQYLNSPGQHSHQHCTARSTKHSLSTVRVADLCDLHSFSLIPSVVFVWTLWQRGLDRGEKRCVRLLSPCCNTDASSTKPHCRPDGVSICDFSVTRVDVLLFRGKMRKGGKKFSVRSHPPIGAQCAKDLWL